jgi:hypothetical protein
MATMQYAKLPRFQYQTFEGQHHYQSYNPQTLGYTYHPIAPKPATPAPPEKDNEEVTNTEPEKENTEQAAEQAVEESPPAPAEESPAPQDEGKSLCQFMN